ncbi:MAG: FxsA family protein [Rhodococcus sp.]|nr:FxsA family protein [Rhodococcus sp. (in: high G+C Gram-positive bacteria)]
MFAVLFLLYVIVEVTALIVVGNLIGVGWTILLILAGMAVGLILIRTQWQSVVRGFRNASQGRGDAGSAVADGALVAIGSVLMLVPGLVTSALALVFLLPPTRRIVRPLAVFVGGRKAAMVVAGASTAGRVGGNFYRGRAGGGDVIDGDVIDTEFVDNPTRTEGDSFSRREGFSDSSRPGERRMLP